MTKLQTSPKGASRRWGANPIVVTLWLGLSGLLATACGGSDSAADDAALEVAGDDAASEAADDSGDSGDDSEAAGDAHGPAPALPIARVYEFDQRARGLESFDGQLYFFDIGTMFRLDPDSGELSSFPVVQPDEYNPWPVWLTKSDTHLVFSGSNTDFGFEVIGSVDPIAFERGETYAVARGDDWITPQKGEGGDVIVHDVEGAHVLDTDTMTLSEPLGFATPADHVFRADNEYWVWHLDGTGGVFDRESGEELSSFDMDTSLSRFLHAVVAVDADTIWHGDAVGATVTGFDRATGEIIAQVDHSARYGDDMTVRLGLWSDPESPFLVAQVTQGFTGWFVLIELDMETGEVASEHVIAPFGPDSIGEILWDLPEVEMVGDRLFVRDHSRRIVEVDMAQLGTDTGSWESPGIEFGPVLDVEEQVIADLVDAAMNGELPATTDPELVATVGNYTFFSPGPWVILEVVIEGDRAWAVARDEAKRDERPLVFRRVDGEWLLEADTVCLWSKNFGLNDCDY